MEKPDDMKWLRLPITPEVRKSLKMEALRRETTLADLVGGLLEQWVDHGMPEAIVASATTHKSNPFTD